MTSVQTTGCPLVQLSITLPRNVQRVTAKFVLEVAFSVLVTLAATKIVSHVVGSPADTKATFRAELTVPDLFARDEGAGRDRASSALTPSMSRFMEEAALAHVAPARVEDSVTPAAPAVSAAPAVWAAAQHGARSAAATQAPRAPEKAQTTPAARLAATPVAFPPTRPRLEARVPEARVAEARPGEPILRPQASIPAAATAPTVIPAPAIVAAAPAAAPAQKKTFIAKVGDAVPSPGQIVDSVAEVGSNVGHVIGGSFNSLIRRF